MNTTRQSKTWPFDLIKGIILLILLGLMLYLRPDMSAQIQRQLGLPFGTVTVLDAPQVTGTNPTTLSGHTDAGATVEVFAGEANLGTATADADGRWSLPVTLPAGTYQLRAQARDAAGTALGSPAVLEWTSEQQAAAAETTGGDTAPAATATPQEAAAASQAGGDTSAETGTDSAAGTDTDDGTDSGTAAQTEAATPAESESATAAGSAAKAPSLAPPEIAADGITFTGSGEPGTTIVVVSAAGTVGRAQVGQNGTWTLQVRLAPGKYELQARAIDASGATAGSSPVVAVTVPGEGAASAAAAGAAGAAADNGAQSASAAPSASAQGSLGAAQVADGTANLSGGGTPGTTVEIVALAAASGETTAGTGAVTNSAGNKTDKIENTGDGSSAEAAAAEAGAGEKGAAAEAVLGSVVVAADGTWQLSAKVNPGDYMLAVRTLDADGATVDESEGVPLSVPGAAAAASEAADEAGQGSGPGVAATAGVTASESATVSVSAPITAPVASAGAPQVSAPVVADDKVTLTGMATPGAAVELVTNDEVLGEAVADADGLWLVAVQLDPGSYALRVRAVDATDKSVQYSRVVSLTLPAAGSPAVAAGDTITTAAAAAVAATVAPTATKSTTTTVAAPAAAAEAVSGTVSGTTSGIVSGTGTAGVTAPAVKGTAAVTSTAHNAAAGATVTTTAATATTAVSETAPATGTAASATPAVKATSAVTPTAHGTAAGASVTTTAAANATGVTATLPTTATTATTATHGTTAAAPAATATPSTPPTLGKPELSGSTLTLSGTGTPGTSVEIVSGTTVLGKATVDADGSWSLASEVKPGSYKLQVVRKDAAGKVISQSPVVSLDIPSAAPVLETPEIAADNTITLTGTGAPGSEIDIVQDGTVIATAPVQDDGQWVYAYPAAKTGNVQVAAQVTGEPATRTKPVIVVVPVVVAPAAPAPTPTTEPTPEPTAEPTAEPEPTTNAAESTGGQAYVVQPGDTLTALAQEYLGSETRYKEIVAATNEMAKQDPAYKQITDPNMIVVGQQIWIPAR